MIQGPTKIGRFNKIYQFASVGNDPQDINYQGEPTRLEIGDHNVIREYGMMSRGTLKGGALTKIGDHNYFMAYTHVGHDCVIGNHTIMVNYAALSGHVTVHDYATIGGYAAVHQFCHVGAYAFIARATYVTKDVLPYLMVIGTDASDAKTCGLNTIGLKRRGFTATQVNLLKRAYKIIFRQNLTVQQAIDELVILQEECAEISAFVDMLRDSERGIVR